MENSQWTYVFGMKCWRYETTDEVWNCFHVCMYENVDDGMKFNFFGMKHVIVMVSELSQAQVDR